jgi:hypothetical protein
MSNILQKHSSFAKKCLKFNEIIAQQVSKHKPQYGIIGGILT